MLPGCSSKVPQTQLLRTEMYCPTVPEARRPCSLCRLQGKDGDCPGGPQDMASRLRSSCGAVPGAPPSVLCACPVLSRCPFHVSHSRSEPTHVTLFKFDYFCEDSSSRSGHNLEWGWSFHVSFWEDARQLITGCEALLCTSDPDRRARVSVLVSAEDTWRLGEGK